MGLLAAGCFSVTTMLLPSVGNAQADPKVQTAMASLKAATSKLGAPKVDGLDAVSGKDASSLYFGTPRSTTISKSLMP
jgi:hypothetical protein